MRLVRHLSFSNVIAVIALFIALGGAAYAGSKINGKNIVNKSIGGGKLKNETITANKIKKGTITSAQIAPGSIDSTQININTLTTVPSAQTATTATTAKTAETATKATSAVTADEAGEAKEADSAKHAKEADNALHANEADVATIAGEAQKLNGKTASQLTLACPEKTEFYGGMCWDKTTRAAKLWLGAIKECGEAGGRLPSIAELIAFVLRPEEQVSEQVWSADLIDSTVGEGEVFTTDENGRAKTGPGLHGFRCVFPMTNG